MNFIKTIWRNNGLSIVLLAIFMVLMAGQTLTGLAEYNDERAERHQAPVALSAYLATGHFVEATMENWESEFLQMGAFIIITVSLCQKGSAESREPGESEPQDEDPRLHRSDPGVPWPVRRGGWILWLYERSLGLAFGALFFCSFFLHAWGGEKLYNEEQIAVGKPPITFFEFLGTARFWFESFQNWQSEFLAIAAMVVLTIFLRQRGSPESKPVATPHSENGE
jgi:hypothetical protein